jgi:hypothetical protein
MAKTEKTEIVCITRSGFNFLHTEDMDLAAKVTVLRYVPGEVYDPRNGVVQELFIPRHRG